MTEDLQHLLETIRKEGVEKAEAEAAGIVSGATEKAREILHEAETRASETLSHAEKKAADFEERATRALEQAARDILISLGRSMETILKETVTESVGETLTPDTLKEILSGAVASYLKQSLKDGHVDLHLSEEDERALQAFFRAELRKKLGQGVELHPSDQFTKGFRISFRNAEVYHDFTQEAIAEELCRFLRPRLRDVVRRAIGKKEGEC